MTLGRQVVSYVVPSTGIVVAPITEVLWAELLGPLGAELMLWCEIDNDLPPVTHHYYLLSEGQDVPLIERPLQTFVETLGGHRTLIDGPVEHAFPSFVIAVTVRGPTPYFVYDLPQ